MYIYPRPWLVISSQMNINSAFEQDLLEVKSLSPKDILILGTCLHYSSMNSAIRCAGEDVYKYPNVLQVCKIVITAIIKTIFVYYIYYC